MHRHIHFSTALILFTSVLTSSCSTPETSDTRTPIEAAYEPGDLDSYELENLALDLATERTGLPREASLWIKRSITSGVACGALARPEGTPLLFLAGRGGGFLGLPIAQLQPHVVERTIDRSNRAVMTACAEHRLVPPARVQALLADTN